jgi:transposase
MPAPLRLREVTTEEQHEIERLRRSKTAPARLVERARMLALAQQGHTANHIAAYLHVDAEAVRHWLKGFNAAGLSGLEDQPRPGRPATYTVEEVSTVIATALSKPEALGLPFASWTLDRLQAYLNEVKGLPIKRSRIDDLLLREGLRWRQQERWLGERVDPDFAEKRGPSKRSTRRPRRTQPLSV